MPPTPTHQSRRYLGIGVGLALVVAVIVLAFSWPAVTADPRGVPLVVTGPDQQVTAVSAALEKNLGDAVALTTVADRDAAVTAIEQRDAYGAIVLGPSPEVLKATAASPVAAQMVDGLQAPLDQIVTAMSTTQANGTTDAPATTGQVSAAPAVTVTDVVPLLDTDPRGAGLSAATLPLVLGGLVGGVAISLLVGGIWRRLAALTVYAVAAGLLITAVLQTWFEVLGGAYLANAAVFTLCLLAIGTTIVGFASLLGMPGIPIGPVLFLLVANPIAGVTMPPEFLPAPWGTIGQMFPPGAGATLVRDVSYFPDAATTVPWLVLVGWTALGLVLAVLAHLRASRATSAVPAEATSPSA